MSTSQKILDQIATDNAARAAESMAAVSTAEQIAAGADDTQMIMLQNMITAQAQMIADLQALVPRTAAREVVKKTYFSVVPVCNIHVMRSPGHCEALQFVAGRLETSDAVVQDHLDAICDRPGSGITSEKLAALPEEATMRKDMLALAAIAHGKMVAAGEKTA